MMLPSGYIITRPLPQGVGLLLGPPPGSPEVIPIYITPSRYRAAGFGIDVSDMEDAELAAVLRRASSLVDTYCAIPLLPSRHDFRGGSITNEQLPWRLGTETWTRINGTRRVYFKHPPIQTVTSFVVKFTNTYQVEIDPANLYINRIEGWAEVVSLAAVVSGMYPVGINFGLYTPVAEVSYTYGYAFEVIGERMYVTDGNTYQAGHGAWSISPDPVIYRNGVAVTTGFTIDYDEGEVTFTSPNAATDVITADYTYTLPDGITQATAITATSMLGERALAAKDMTGLSSIKVAEVALARTNRGMLGLQALDAIPMEAASLLDPFIFRSVA